MSLKLILSSRLPFHHPNGVFQSGFQSQFRNHSSTHVCYTVALNTYVTSKTLWSYFTIHYFSSPWFFKQAHLTMFIQLKMLDISEFLQDRALECKSSVPGLGAWLWRCCCTISCLQLMRRKPCTCRWRLVAEDVMHHLNLLPTRVREAH